MKDLDLTEIVNQLAEEKRACERAQIELVKDPIATELLQILQSGQCLRKSRQRVREIGNQLKSHRTGINEMRRVYMLIKRAYPSGTCDWHHDDGWHPRELSFAWNGIGHWMD